MSKAYTVKWSMTYVADNPLDALKQAVGEIQDPQMTCTFFDVWLDGNKVSSVDAQPLLRGEEIDTLDDLDVLDWRE